MTLPISKLAALVLLLLSLATAMPTRAEEEQNTPGYRSPSEAIIEALEAQPRPLAVPGPDGKRVALLFRAAMPSIEELARPTIGLAGRLLDPASNGPARGVTYEAVSIVSLPDAAATEVALPGGALISTLRWSPDGSSLAFLLHGTDVIELWVADARDGHARKVATGLNAVFAEPFQWMPGSQRLLVRLVPETRGAAPGRPAVVASPEIRETGDEAVPVQTLSNLLGDAHDDALFRHYARSQLALVDPSIGALERFGDPAIFHAMAASPDGRMILVERLCEPFSRAFSAPDFPRDWVVIERESGRATVVASLAGSDREGGLADGADRGRRGIGWRPDRGAVIHWLEAEEGAPGDRLYQLASPYSQAPERLAEIGERIMRIWFSGRSFAVMQLRSGSVIFDASRSEQEVNRDTGPVMEGESHLLTDSSGLLALSPEGDLLLLEDDALISLDPQTGEKTLRANYSSTGHQRVIDLIDPASGLALAWRESRTEPPNLHLLDPGSGATLRLTNLADPAPAYAAMRTIPLSYVRDDGVPLSAKLYLPASLAAADPRPLPALFWAYPVNRNRSEMERDGKRQKSSRFVRPHGIDPLLLTASGYAVIIADMPIVDAQEGLRVGFDRQLVANASAAIDAAAATGWVDRKRIAAAGHSFGAGMVANLLAGSDLFASGIALSGAYNRTLTPFGFQTERRNLWEAPKLYEEASPILRADAITEPLLLVHGTKDTNSGTLPMQSERMFEALRGLGSQAQLVLLPNEGHQYTARQSVYHVMYEIEMWLANTL